MTPSKPIIPYGFCHCGCGGRTTLRKGKYPQQYIAHHHPQSPEGIERIRSIHLNHGHTAFGQSSPTYNSWRSMVARCRDEKNEKFPRYGGRGIEVCSRWLVFENFLEDMGERPAGKTIDRRNNNGNYTPDNCRWATRKQQSRNSPHTRLVEYKGEEMSQSEAARLMGIPQTTLNRKLRNGISFEDICHDYC